MVEINKKYINMPFDELVKHRTEFFDLYKYTFSNLVIVLKGRNMPIFDDSDDMSSIDILEKFYMDASRIMWLYDDYALDNRLEYPPYFEELLFWIELYEDIYDFHF